jgi:predicted RNA-binding protein with PIN domain
MPILIDGHNLIGQIPSLSLEDPDDEEKLVRRLVSYAARTGKKLTVIFDPGAGFSPAESFRHGGINVAFAPHGSSADAVIRRRVRTSSNPRDWLVVTSDRQLGTEVVQLGGRVITAGAFAPELESTPGPEPDWREQPPAEDEVELWLKLMQGES